MSNTQKNMESLPIYGNKKLVADWLQHNSIGYYVYVLRRPDSSPFYVGKGRGMRLFQHESEARQAHPFGETNPFKCNIIRKIINSGKDVIYEIDSIFPDDQEINALEREARLIFEWKRFHEGGVLSNLAGGIGNQSGSSPFSKKRHDDTLFGAPENNPERATLNNFLQEIGPVKSVCIKPVSQLSRILPSTPHTQPRKPTQRCAYALIASAVANGISLSKPCEIPRNFEFEGVEGIIENGVSRDILKANMASLISADDPRDEKYSLNVQQLTILIGLYGRKGLEVRGLL